MKSTICILYFLVVSFGSSAQNSQARELESIDGIIHELLHQITIIKGEKMDTAAIRDLFHPSAIFTVSDSNHAETVSLDEFLALLTDPYYEQGYLEKEIHKVVHEYNGIAQVFQNFYGQHSDNDKEQGMNSYQLTYHHGRWWIVSLLWTTEPDPLQPSDKY